MPKSLRCKIKHLCYNGTLTERERDRILKALDREDVLDKISAEIAEYGSIWVAYAVTDKTKTDKGIDKLVSDVLKQAKKQVLNVIDKYKAESEDAE